MSLKETHLMSLSVISQEHNNIIIKDISQMHAQKQFMDRGDIIYYYWKGLYPEKYGLPTYLVKCKSIT